MPTGYTAPVKDGEITSLADFALTCSRGFGALVLLRDNEQSLEATRRYIESEDYLASSSYYADEMAKAQARLAELEAMDEREALAAAQEAADEVIAQNRHNAEARLVERERYEAMEAKVEAWEPPTRDHIEFKNFMLKQIRESIEFDCSPFAMRVPDVSLGWRETEIEQCRKRIARAEEEIENERARNENRRAWVTALLDSLEPEPSRV